MEHRSSREMAAPPSKLRATTGDRRTAMRVMHRKSQGIVAVYEQDPTVSEAGTRTLIFESSGHRKAVAKFPPEWHRLSDDELVAIQRSN